MGLVTRFRCIRCKQQYSTVAKLAEHSCPTLGAATGILAVLEDTMRRDDAPMPDSVRAALATKEKPKAIIV